MFAVRSYLLDLGGGKVPTMATFRRIVDLLAKFGYNQLQLHCGHAFAHPAHGAVWAGSTPLTPREARQLDGYCVANGIELVPVQPSLGGLSRWLGLPEHRALAAPAPTARRRPPGTLAPGDPAALGLLAGIYDGLLPNFTARHVNVGCGASPEVADAAAYLRHVEKVCAMARERGRRPMLWADFALRHPEALKALPKDVVALDWGYEGMHPFSSEAAELAAAGLEFYVCAGTGAWNSLTGRLENMRENFAAAEAAGRNFGAKGFLVADWAGTGHWQPLAASLPGLVLGGFTAEQGATAARMNLEETLDAVMGAPLGGVLLRLGTLYLRGGALRPGCTELYRILAADRGYSRHPGLTDPILSEISSVAEGCRHDARKYSSCAFPNIWAEEIAFMANLVDAACHRRDGGRLKALRAEHEHVWRLRYREGGLKESLALLPRF